MANLLVEVGNTALKAAWAEGNVLGKIFRYQGEKRMDFILSITEKEKPYIMTVCSSGTVTPEEQAVLEKECSHLLILDRNNTSLLLNHGLPEYLSYDRAAAIVAAKFLFKDKSVSIFDFGTTLTCDFIDVSGRYAGGNIAPGCRTRFKSLERYSRTLPLVDTPEEIVPAGLTLESSIQSGVISGIMFEIEGYMRLYPGSIMVFTGGDAIYFAKKMKSSIFVVSNLVPMGLALITEDYVRKNLQ